jgi:signal transduction histidine kinase
MLSSLVKTSPEITEEAESRIAQVGLVLQIAIMAVFLSTIMVRWLSIVNAPVPEWAFVAVLGTYLLGRTKHYKIALALFIAIVNILPYYILISFAVSDPQRVFTALIWVPLFVLLASFLMGARETAVITILNLIIISILPFYITDMMLIDLGYLISYTVTLSVTIIVGSYLRERYVDRITHQRRDLRKRMDEIEFLSTLLKHDLSNDLDIILRATDVLSLESSEESIRKNVSIIDASGERMKRLLSILAQVTDTEELDCITMIEHVAAQAMKIHNNLSVEILYDERLKKKQIEGNRLLPLAFENLLRNVAAHAGENPTATIEIECTNDSVIFDVIDDGPGLPDSVRKHLFDRGSLTNGDKKGQGLYLAKSIIEAHGGTISLREDYGHGAAFRIILKAT